MSSAPSITSAWQHYADFYRWLSKKRGWSNQAAMLAFVERIAPLAIAQNIYPSCSHQILNLYHEYRGCGPTVSVCCWGTDGRFAIFWTGKWTNPETVEYIDDALWQRIVAKVQAHQ